MILRVPVLFGEVESVVESAVTALWLKVEEADEDGCSALDHCLQRFPTDARDVAAVCRKLAERGRQVRQLSLSHPPHVSLFLCLTLRLSHSLSHSMTP